MATKFDTRIHEILTGKKVDIPKKKLAKICGATKGEKGLCRRPAGQRTDHPGVGRCKYHDGKPTTTGLFAQIQHPILADILHRLSEDERVFDLREQIRLQVALQTHALRLIEDDPTIRRSFQFIKIGDKVSSNIERLHRIELSEKYVLSIEVVGAMIRKLVDIMADEIADPMHIAHISERMMGLVPVNLEDGLERDKLGQSYAEYEARHPVKPPEPGVD